MPQPVEREERVDPLDRARVRRDELREAAGRDRGRVGAELARGCGRRCRPPGPRTRRRARTAGRRPSSCRSRSPARRSRRSTRRAARAKSASIEISIPGASTPPTYSPSGETTSKFVEVPKSTTIDGRAVALLRGDRVDDPVGADLARVVVADRDAGLDARADDEERRVRPPFAASRSHSRIERRHGRREADRRRRRRGRAARRAARRARHPSRCARSRARQWSRSRSPSYRPSTVCVLPTSTQRRSMGPVDQTLRADGSASALTLRRTSSSPESGSPIRSASASAREPRLVALAASSSTVTSPEV